MILQANEREILTKAYEILQNRRPYNPVTFDSIETAKKFFRLRLFGLASERFDVAFLNTQMELIECSTIFMGSLNSCNVSAREVVKRALELNAKHLIIAHNHPSGCVEASEADKFLTRKLVEACTLFEIIIRDHIIVGAGCFSFAETGLL